MKLEKMLSDSAGQNDRVEIVTIENINSKDALPNELYQKLFTYLDLQSLKAARSVCQSWNENALIIMKKRCGTLIKIADYKKCVNFIETFKNASEVPFQVMTLTIETGARFDKMYELLGLVGASLKKIVIIWESCIANGAPYISCSCNDIIDILKLCKNVERLALIVVNKASAASMGPISEIEGDGELFSNIKSIVIKEIPEKQHNEVVNFSIGKIFTSHFAKHMPNLCEIYHRSESQYQFNEFMDQFKANREKGLLKNLKKLKLKTKNDGRVFLSKKHWQPLRGLKLETINFVGFSFVGCSAINEEDISTEEFYDFFRENNQSLKMCIFQIFSNREEGKIKELAFPVMENLTNLSIGMLDSLDIIQNNDNLAKLLPNLKVLTVHSKEEPQIVVAYPCLKSKKVTILSLGIPPEKIGDGYRLIDLKHFTSDYYFLKPDVFGIIFKWFPTATFISAQVKIHFGLLNLLRGLSQTPIEEIIIKVNCLFCALDETEMAVQPRNDYESVFRYNLLENVPNPCFPELRKLDILNSGCRSINFRYLYDSDVMKLLMAAPKLKNISITEAYLGIPNKVVTSYNASNWESGE